MLFGSNFLPSNIHHRMEKALVINLKCSGPQKPQINVSVNSDCLNFSLGPIAAVENAL